MIGRRRFLSITAAAIAAPRFADASVARWSGVVMGAEANLTLQGPDDRTRPALEKVATLLQRLEASFSLYQPTSDICLLNATGMMAGPDADWRRVLSACDLVHTATEGLFDPTVQPLWRALATGGDADAARGLVGWSRLRHDTARIQLGKGQAITLNGIAQGYATDRVADLLHAEGFGKALINIGEFRSLGGPWTIGLSDPVAGHLGTRQLTDGAIATSSPDAMTLADGGHILSPTGQTAQWSTVSVEAASATIADATSTALCLAPLEKARAIATRLPDLRRITLVDAEGDIRTIVPAV